MNATEMNGQWESDSKDLYQDKYKDTLQENCTCVLSYFITG
mgnify:CR=1 FL=1